MHSCVCLSFLSEILYTEFHFLYMPLVFGYHRTVLNYRSNNLVHIDTHLHINLNATHMQKNYIPEYAISNEILLGASISAQMSHFKWQ